MMLRHLAAGAALGTCAILPAAAAAAQLQAGASRVAITPPAGIFPYVVQREKPIVGVHDDIYARAIVIGDGTRRVALVSIEVTTIPTPDRIVAAVAAALQLPASAVLVMATHTHSVPLTFLHSAEPTPVQAGEIDRIGKAAVQAAQEAAAKLQPARIGFARGQAFVNTNNGEEAGREGWYDPDGSSDKSLDVIRIATSAGQPIALLLNYATHGEVMFRSVTKDGGYEVTGDLPGAVSRLLESQSGGAPVTLFTSAAEADQLPLFKSLQPAADFPATDEGAAGWGILDLQARRLAAAVLDTVKTMKPGVAAAPISVKTGEAVCAGQKYDVERPSGKLLGIRETAPVTIPLSTIRIGDIALAGVGADIASNIGRAIKSSSPVPDTIVVTMTAGAVGYVLNDAAYRNPGHGALGSPVKPGCAQAALAGGVAKLLR